MTTTDTTTRALLIGLAISLVGCSDASDPPTSPTAQGRLAPPPDGEGFQLSYEVTAPASSEIYKCRVDWFPSETTTWINRVESRQNTGMHHMDVISMAFVALDLEPGEYECADLYESHPAMMEEIIVMYAAQAAEQQIVLPPGVAANVPSGMKIMHELHYVNTSDEDVTAFSDVNVYTIPKEEVVDTIWGSVSRDTHLNIPPQSKHVEWTRCVMTEDVDVILMSSHTHALAESVEVRLFDGETVSDEVIYRSTNWESPELAQIDLHVKKGTGFEYTCNYDNHRDELVTWGLYSSDEMCQIVAVHTPGDSSIKCEIVETSDGVIDETGMTQGS